VSQIPATYVDVQRALASGEYDGWHFTGHGGARNDNPDRSVMFLNNNEPFTPEDVSGVVSNLGLRRPIVFLNACQIGRAGMSLTDIGGWAKRFVDAGAGMFLGAYWSVYDKPAFDFAQALYDRLLSGMPVGAAVKEARAAIRSSGDPTWLAYTVFADPLARLT
jgi:CHAT domain-containing protein